MAMNVNEKELAEVSYDVLFKHMRIQAFNPDIFLSPHPQQTSVATQTPLRHLSGHPCSDMEHGQPWEGFGPQRRLVAKHTRYH